MSPSAISTEVAEPLPRPPIQELNNPVTSHTIASNPDLFQIVTPIKIDILEGYLASHPNQPFICSILAGLQEGFWPYSDVSKESGNSTRDYNRPYDFTPEEQDFLLDYFASEQDSGRYSDMFGPELMPGMVSQPTFVVTREDKLRLVNDHTAGEHSLNSTIAQEDRSIRLDNMHDFGGALRAFHKKHGRGPRHIFKSDVSSAFRLLPMHPNWQIRQIVTLNLPDQCMRFVDRCCCFGNGASPNIWCSFFGCIIWIAIVIKGITNLFHYMDDAFGFDDDDELEFYAPYACKYPRKQVQLLQLWDELGIPHRKKKQEFGSSLEIIGLYINPQDMTITMSEDRRSSLINEIDLFTQQGRMPRLLDWQRLAGWVHWSLNAYPLLRPAMNPVHSKIAGKRHRYATIPVNKDVRVALTWFRDRLASVPGVSILEAELWGEAQADLVIWCDACTGDSNRPPGLGFWSPVHQQGFFGQAPSNTIFYLEALCVVSAILWAASLSPPPTRLLIYTDSINTADMFCTMRAQPGYNDLLMAAVETLLDKQISLRVFHIAGEQNIIADALSRSYFNVIQHTQPHLKLIHFQPPRFDAGAAKK